MKDIYWITLADMNMDILREYVQLEGYMDMKGSIRISQFDIFSWI